MKSSMDLPLKKINENHKVYSLCFQSIPVLCPITSAAAVINIKKCKSPGGEELFFEVQTW